VQADDLLAAYHGAWGESLGPIYQQTSL
jgi:gamma-glutamylcysteine synthetase